MGRKKNNTTPPVVSDKDRFWTLMNTPLQDVSDEDLDWAHKQDRLNSLTSKSVWKCEIERRKKLKNVSQQN